MEKRNEKVKKSLPTQRKTKGNSCIIRSTEESTPSHTHQNENKEKELGHMLNKRWIAGAVLGAFLSVTAATGAPQAEASALTATPQVKNEMVQLASWNDHHKKDHDKWDKDKKHKDHKDKKHPDKKHKDKKHKHHKKHADKKHKDHKPPKHHKDNKHGKNPPPRK